MNSYKISLPAGARCSRPPRRSTSQSAFYLVLFLLNQLQLLQLLRSTDSFRRDLKTFLFRSFYGHQDTD